MSDLAAMESETPNIPPPREIQLPSSVPSLDQILSANDFSLAAQKALSPKAWAFYSSAATDLVTVSKNKELIRRVMLRPRILRNVAEVSIKRNILGLESKAPFIMCPAAMATLAHPDGELGWSRAAASEGIFEIISSNASYSLPSIICAAPAGHPFFLQLYVNSHRPKTIELLRRARSLGIKGIFVTVDAPVPGKREADERAPQPVVIKSAMSGSESSKDGKGSGLGRLMGQYIDKSLRWEDLEWIRKESSVPIVLKGVQTVEDVKLAVEYGVEGVMLSNHGGRSLDGAQASILILLEVRKRFPEAFDHLQIFIDGGFERGSDILKAIALGATAVGIARPFLYSLVYGQKGVEHLSQILKDELETSMRLAGITSLDQATPDLVNTLDVDHLVTSGRIHPSTVSQRVKASKL
ncbi:L-lactate dehydrogenase (cytochrome) [Fusarium beomiforme]|uniref:L-lactate dehydrogenase (cytochrome) n=1 Tax=Fusarium beomiforme TaxID=44412 RepID=A0A9P5DVI1_9HYPO|nr:L-lactate dehydrogenase (cytochrome) [Fusarium beomiforme]